MKKIGRLALLLFLLLSLQGYSQVDTIPPSKVVDSVSFRPDIENRSTQKKKDQELSIAQYQIISFDRDTTYLDTTLTINKEYKYNYLRQDNFELMPFSNVGQPYNTLGFTSEREQYFPRIGARARHFNYMEIEDIPYYNVPTPMTDLMFKTTFEQGQMLDALLTFNTSRNTNFSIAYKGFRSLGKYQFDQGQSGNFRTSFNTKTRNGKYQLRVHYAAQEIEGEENGGLLNKEEQFESGNPDFDDRSRLDVQFTNADNNLVGKRIYLDHSYRLFATGGDSLKTRNTSLSLGHAFSYESKFYQFVQSAEDDFFGDVIVSPVDDKARLKTTFNEVSLNFENQTLGRLTGFAQYYDYRYSFDSELTTSEGVITNALQGEEMILGAAYAKRIGDFNITGKGMYTISGVLTDNWIDAQAMYRLKEGWTLKAGIHNSSRLPNYNFLLYQSEYLNYNWQNDTAFENESVSSLRFGLKAGKWGEVDVNYSLLDNYTYFRSTATPEQIEMDQENAFVAPFQESNTINHLRVKVRNEIRWKKWALNNTLLFQDVTQDNEILNLPALVTRNSLYFSSDVFKRAMFLQTGVTLKYFTSYTMNAYNPLLAEFYIQTNEEIGGYPMLDFFINAKVRQTRIYLKAEHFNSSFSGNNFYAAPNYPYRDFVIRFGVVWNFFS